MRSMRQRVRSSIVAATLGLALGLVACGELRGLEDQANFGPSDAGASAACRAANDCPGGWSCNALGYCQRATEAPTAGDTSPGASPTPPPEVELTSEPPAVGRRFVYVALPDEARVARIEASTLTVQLRALPGLPTALRTVPGQDIAVVLSGGAARATVLRAREDGTDNQVELPVVPSANALFIGPGGESAIALFDPARQAAASLSTHASLHEITLLRLAGGKERAITLAVGFRPREVRFAPDGTRAVVIAERSVTVLRLAELSAATFVPGVPLSADPLSEPAPSEVQITPDGGRAIVRLPGRPLLRVIELADGSIQDLALAAEPTDIDLSADGRQAVLVLRETKAVLVVDLSGDLSAPSARRSISTAPYLVGQTVLDAASGGALAFSNAVTQEVLVRVDLSAGTVRPLRLEKGVSAVVAAPDGRSALVVHSRVAQPGPEVSDPLARLIDQQDGYSVIDLRSEFVALHTTPAAPGSVVFAPDGASAYLLLSDPARGTRRAELIDLRSLLVRSTDLASTPVALGVLPDGTQLYVAQRHPLGRMTFIDTREQRQRTLTGFALNSQIIE